ncbi:hypothetical protein DdX_06373 [Ditylenchus destructor]|uniref:Uncharacterized protein n=1 Tax=Ditylenchus destructor TaxID=166010 RepID=A0AAD4R2F9_9BILA|nr:hypothetical protein DdX_06373 [Ditylenchus destructor]
MRISTSEKDWDFWYLPYFGYGESEFDLRSGVLYAGRWNDGQEDGIDDGMDVAAGWKPAVMIAGPWKTSNLVETVESDDVNIGWISYGWSSLINSPVEISTITPSVLVPRS